MKNSSLYSSVNMNVINFLKIVGEEVQNYRPCIIGCHNIYTLFTCGWCLLTSTRLSIVRAKAAVFPVPFCDWAIILRGLKNKHKKLKQKCTPIKHLSSLKISIYRSSYKGKYI